MSYPFSYRLPSLVAKFKQIRCMSLWAAGLGVAQSLIWIGLTLTSILAYNCVLPAPDALNYGTLVSYSFYDLYFRGSCKPPNVIIYNTEIVDSVPMVLEPWQYLVWNSVYLGVAVVWLISSILLITHVKKSHAAGTAIILWIWIAITFIVSAMDLSLGIIFGIDYGSFHDAALAQNFNTMESGAVDANAVQLLAAAVTALSLMFVALKGFVLWIINVGLVGYFIAQAIGISTERDNNDTLFVTRSDNDDMMHHQSPIQAYEEKTEVPKGYNNDAYVPDNRSTGTVELNQGPIQRAAQISNEVALQERRFRNIEAFQQYPPPPVYQNSTQRRTEPVMAPQPPANNMGSGYPVPDYSPPMPRANQQRYQ